MSVDYVTLHSGDKMPLRGFGCWKIDKKDAEDTIYQAIKVGYRLFDGACDYGNEVEVGRGVNKAIKEGLVKREELFIVTKLWNTFHNKQHVRAAFDRQLKDWGLDYFDLYLIHFPIPLQYVDPSINYPPEWYVPGANTLTFEPSPLHECWTELEKLVEANLTRNIGIANFNCQTIMDMLTYAKIKPAVLQIEIHPYLPQERLIKWVKDQGIQVTAYSSFGPTSYVNLSEFGKDYSSLLEHDHVKSIANKHNVTTGQVLLRWALDREIAVIPKSSNEDRMKSNFDILDIKFDEQDNKTLDALKSNQRFNDPMIFGFGVPLFD
ncbi:4-dihydromethyltrisporate dehydrogenase [Gilbertella persicaria]|uniref:NAD(P)H-dependent D-xylose reductase (XR) n=1 Tax=Rhizopus stolonifer TaxID=4846 RepID=A0A367KNS5_RHIST|nr:4-dihydromethyltrisporate dehydrogenase [Gilbertella persicaria]KAI8078161.1 4-dihydromethyltrisporate dehydrogenase [Gilbertella persicaria]RCI03492.1 NAD(P)H-dependent D-xylose reductase (XR) [Rhizopus stolonifer]